MIFSNKYVLNPRKYKLKNIVSIDQIENDQINLDEISKELKNMIIEYAINNQTESNDIEGFL